LQRRGKMQVSIQLMAAQVIYRMQYEGYVSIDGIILDYNLRLNSTDLTLISLSMKKGNDIIDLTQDEIDLFDHLLISMLKDKLLNNKRIDDGKAFIKKCGFGPEFRPGCLRIGDFDFSNLAANILSDEKFGIAAFQV
jgi:hypothetical protein